MMQEVFQQSIAQVVQGIEQGTVDTQLCLVLIAASFKKNIKTFYVSNEQGELRMKEYSLNYD